jgi:hypothetical protein
MQMEKVDVKNPTPKLVYEKPQLVSYGDLRTITKAGAGGSGDGAGTTGHSMPCWVAEVLYGTSDPRTQVLRCWLTQEYARTAAGSMIVGLYRAIGRKVAWLACRSRAVQTLLRPLFDRGLMRAQRHYMQG